MDIRKFFAKSNLSKKKKKAEEALAPAVAAAEGSKSSRRTKVGPEPTDATDNAKQQPVPPKHKKKRLVIDDDDSDDDVVPVAKPAAFVPPSARNNSSSSVTKAKAKPRKAEPKKRKEVSVHDFFNKKESSESPPKKPKTSNARKPTTPPSDKSTEVTVSPPLAKQPSSASKAAAAAKTSSATKKSRAKPNTATTKKEDSSSPSPCKKPKTSKPKREAPLQPGQPQSSFDAATAVPECLKDMTFCFTGMLDTLGREDATELVRELGGRVTTCVSKRTDYLVAGPVLEDGREYTEGSKYKHAQELGTIVLLGQDALYGILHQYNDRAKQRGGVPAKPESSAPAPVAAAPKPPPSAAVASAASKPAAAAAAPKPAPSAVAKVTVNPYAKPVTNPYATKKSVTTNRYGGATDRTKPAAPSAPATTVSSPLKDDGTMLWVDKYKPQTTREILGNEASVSKLRTWLARWEERFNTPQNIGKSFSNPQGPFKAALLSGPPGIGKTTTATLVAQEAGREVLEFNASDVRSKKAMKEHLGDITGSQTIDFSTKKAPGKAHAKKKKRCIIMDEVDGMGAGDRSGIAELIQMIKNSRVPIICICNDRQAQKLKSLIPYCMDLKYRRPVKSTIAKRAMEIAQREGLTVEYNAAEAIAESCGNDVRQVLNALQMWASDNKGGSRMSYKNLKDREHSINKDEILRVSLFDAARLILEGRKGLMNASPKQQLDSFFQRNDAFFVDYNFTGLLVQQNYPKIVAQQYNRAKIQKDSAKIQSSLESMAAAADSMSDFALAEGALRGVDQNWSLLPIAGMFAVKTGYHAGGENGGILPGFPEFTAWLGKNSTLGKKKRILHELQHHCNFKISGGNEEMRLSYLPVFRERFLSLLLSQEEDAVDKAIDLMDEYGLNRDDIFEKLDEFKMDSKADTFGKIDSKKKAAFTRAYNARSHKSQALVDEQGGAGKKRKATAAVADPVDPDAIDDDKANQEEEEDIEEEDEEKLKALFKKKGRGKGKSASTKAKSKTGASKAKSKKKK